MKTIRNTFILTLMTLMFTSCGLYSQSGYYGGGYYGGGYEDDNYYDDYYDNDYDDDYYAQGDYYDDYYDSDIRFQTFYRELRSHGRWVKHRQYGSVWIPRVGRNFHPYATNGYWVMTDYGNMWVSDYSWGWAPFHYGRWFYDDYYGWAWMPGYEWAPAWVNWRSGGGYYGWAPMGPGVSISININIPTNYWTFLPSRHMYGRNMHRYYHKHSPKIYNQTTIINNTYIYNNNHYYSGPNARDYERETGRRVAVRNIQSTTSRDGRASTRVSNNAVSVFRPDFSTNRATNSRVSTGRKEGNRVQSNRQPNNGDSNSTGRINRDVNRRNTSVRQEQSPRTNQENVERTAPRVRKQHSINSSRSSSVENRGNISKQGARSRNTEGRINSGSTNSTTTSKTTVRTTNNNSGRSSGSSSRTSTSESKIENKGRATSGRSGGRY